MYRPSCYGTPYTYLLTIRGHLADIKHGNTKFQQRIKIRRAEKASKASNN